MVEVDRACLNEASEYIQKWSKVLKVGAHPDLMQAMAQLAIAEQLHNVAVAIQGINLWLWSDQNSLNKK